MITSSEKKLLSILVVLRNFVNVLFGYYTAVLRAAGSCRRCPLRIFGTTPYRYCIITVQHRGECKQAQLVGSVSGQQDQKLR